MIYKTVLKYYEENESPDVMQRLGRILDEYRKQDIKYDQSCGKIYVDADKYEEATAIAQRIMYGSKELSPTTVKVLGWIAVATGLIGQWLVIQHHWLGFVIWFLGNLIWIFRMAKLRDWPQVALFTIYNIMNVAGIVEWLSNR